MGTNPGMPWLPDFISNLVFGRPQSTLVIPSGNMLQGGPNNKAVDSGVSNFPSTIFDSFGILSLASGDNAVYTVPANKCALVRIYTFNATAGAITVFPTLTPAGQATIFRIGASVALGASGAASSDTNYQINNYVIGNPGDVFGVNCTALGVNCHAVILLFDFNNPCQYKQVILKTFIVGDNTIYTVPAGKVSFLCYTSFGGIGSFGTQLLYSNETGGAVAFSFNVVPSGGSVSAANRVISPAAAANGTAQIVSLMRKMNAGDFLSINTASNGKQFISCHVLEVG